MQNTSYPVTGTSYTWDIANSLFSGMKQSAKQMRTWPNCLGQIIA